MSLQAKQVLLVDDEEKLLQSIAQRMRLFGIEPFTATSGMAAIDIVKQLSVDLAIVDLQMPGMDGLVTITKLKEIRPDLKTILLTGYGNEKVKQATESLNTLYFEKEGMREFWRFIEKMTAEGHDVVIRPTASEPIVREADSEWRSSDNVHMHADSEVFESAQPKEASAGTAKNPAVFNRPRIIGETFAMQVLRKNIARAASLDCAITLRGETGTGKELAARVIHSGSLHRARRFLAINCANLGSGQCLGVLLGYKSGNLDEALRTHSGIFSSGTVGTLFFDHVEMMPEQMQTQLLNVLNRANTWPPDIASDVQFNIRILVGTQERLEDYVKAGRFNEDLYDHLKVYELTIPSLRERKDDIPPLCRYFFDKYRQELGKPVESISTEVMEIFNDYDFPGNVRELEHIVERAIVLADGKTIEREHLPRRFREGVKLKKSTGTRHFSTLAELEQRYILDVLEASKGNKSKTAEILGISRAALWRKLKQQKSN